MADDKRTIRVSESAFETAKEQKQANGQTWSEYIADEQRGSGDVDHDEVAKQIKAEIDSLAFDGALTDDEAERLINSVGTIEERLGKVERMVEGIQR